MDEAIRSSDDSEERLEPPPIASTVRRRRYRPAEGLSFGDPKGFVKGKKHVDMCGTHRLAPVRYVYIDYCCMD